MTEPLIRESAPSSSVILAYGTAGRRSYWKTGVLVAAVLLITSFVIALLWTLFSASVPIPTSTSVLIGVSSSEQLSDDAPAIWKEAQTRSRPFPVLLGRATNESGSSTAFAIAPRMFSASNIASKRWIWQVLAEDSTIETTTTHLTALTHNPFSFPWMRIWPLRLGAPVFSADSVGGSLKPTAWNTDLPAPRGTGALQQLVGQNFLDLRALPNTWPFVTALLGSAGYDLREQDIPSIITWTDAAPGTFSAALRFDSPLPETVRAHLAGAAGIYDRTTIDLGDGSTLEDLDYPVELLKNSSSTSFASEDGRRVTFSENTAFFGDPSIATSKTEIPKACQNHVFAAFDRSSLGSFFSNLGILSTSQLQTVYWIEKSGRLTICWG